MHTFTCSFVMHSRGGKNRAEVAELERLHTIADNARRRDAQSFAARETARVIHDDSRSTRYKAWNRTDGRGAGQCDTNATLTNAGKQAHVAA